MLYGTWFKCSWKLVHSVHENQRRQNSLRYKRYDKVFAKFSRSLVKNDREYQQRAQRKQSHTIRGFPDKNVNCHALSTLTRCHTNMWVACKQFIAKSTFKRAQSWENVYCMKRIVWTSRQNSLSFYLSFPCELIHPRRVIYTHIPKYTKTAKTWTKAFLDKFQTV